MGLLSWFPLLGRVERSVQIWAPATGQLPPHSYDRILTARQPLQPGGRGAV